MASLTWQLYTDCDEISELKPLCPELGALNLQFRNAEEYISQGALNRLIQDTLLNVIDSCYVILTNLKVQIQENQKLEYTVQQNWKDIEWCENQIQGRLGTLGICIKGLSAMNTNFQSESRAVVVQKFISVIEEMKSGKIGGSVLIQSLDYVTAEDGESDLVCKSLRVDLEVAGVSISLIDKYRLLITTKFKELLYPGELTGVHDERNGNSPYDQQSELTEVAKISESEKESDLCDREVFFGLASGGHAKRMQAMIQAGIRLGLPDEDGNTALHLAASAGAEGSTVMRCALENSHHLVLQAIANHSPISQTLDAKVDRMGNVNLHYAVNHGYEDSILLLLRSGANPNVQNRVGQTPLHLAAWGRNLIVLKDLLDAEVELDIEDFWGDTALEVAVSSPINITDKASVIGMCLEARLARNQRSTCLDVNLDDAVKFLTMESIYDYKSEDNKFKVSLEGRNNAELLPKQFEMNNLAEKLFDTIYRR